MKNFIKGLIGWVAPFYSVTHIYAIELDRGRTGDQSPHCGGERPRSRSGEAGFVRSVRRTDNPGLATGLTLKQIEQPGPEGFAFGIMHADAPVSLCELWKGDSYHEPSIWKLNRDEALLVRLHTDPAYRGLGLAPRLLAYVESEMARSGFHHLYAVIWWTNRGSVRAFQKAGWVRAKYSLRMQLRFSKRELCWRFHARGGTRGRPSSKRKLV